MCFSTVSTGLNSLAAIWWAELDGTTLKKSLSQRKSGLTVKFLALVFGLLSYALVYVVPYMGGLAPVSHVIDHNQKCHFILHLYFYMLNFLFTFTIPGRHFLVKFVLRVFLRTVCTGNVCSMGKYCCKYISVFLLLWWNFDL